MGQSKNRPKENEQLRRTGRIPYVEGLREEILRIAWKAGLRCVFYAKRTLRVLYSVKDKLPEEKSWNVVYTVKCTTCSEEYIGETESTRSKEERAL